MCLQETATFPGVYIIISKAFMASLPQFMTFSGHSPAAGPALVFLHSAFCVFVAFALAHLVMALSKADALNRGSFVSSWQKSAAMAVACYKHYPDGERWCVVKTVKSSVVSVDGCAW